MIKGQNKSLPLNTFIRSLILLALLLIVALPPHAQATDTFTIGYLELKKDPRYKKKRLFARFMGQPLGRPYGGAEIALKEVRFHGAELGVEFALAKETVKKPEQIKPALLAMQEQGIHFVLLDLPADLLAKAAAEMTGQKLAIFNVSAYENKLRGEQCQAHLFHTLPSHSMLYEALAQYLISKKWRNVLHLEGPLAEDKLLATAFTRAAKKYGIKVTETRLFELSNDPRERAKNNIALITDGKHDAILVTDSQAEFARSVPYQTLKPSLILGSEGLAPVAWHWSWERHGAPQLEKRFEKKHGRPMGSTDWAAWIAVKGIAGAVQSAKTTDFEALLDYLTSDANLLDNFKGAAGGFRPWNNQLRQPILLATHNWVVARAPLKGFLHQKNTLDTLGFDEQESRCKFQ